MFGLSEFGVRNSEPAVGSGLSPTAGMEGWEAAGHRPSARDGASRRPRAVSSAARPRDARSAQPAGRLRVRCSAFGFCGLCEGALMGPRCGLPGDTLGRGVLDCGRLK
jgi:hypothetical protein